MPCSKPRTTAVFGSYLLADGDGVQAVLRDRRVLIEGRRIAAVTTDRPAGADGVLDRPGRFVLPGLLNNLHNHCFSEMVARTRTEDGADDGAADLAAWNALYAQWHGLDHGRIRLAMSPHATDTCGPDLLHALAAHRVQCTPADPALLARHGASVLNCPRVFARGGTPAIFASFKGHGVRTLIGTDGYNPDLLGELHAAALISKTQAGDAEVASSPELIAAATGAAAAAIGRDDLGAIRPGGGADLTIVDLGHPHLQPLFDPRRALVWLANRANVDAVIVDGRVPIADNRYLHGDEAAITAAGAAATQKIWDLPEARAAFAG